ncbi:MAG: sugar ABC transporter substrate-binding protein, partial [Calditrichales bacterium]
GKGARKTIAVIPKGTTHVFWQSVHAGAVKAGQELGVDVVWVGTEKEDDRQQQIALVDNQVMSGVDGIVLAPLDAVALKRPVQNAVQKGIPVIIIDSGLEDAESLISSFIATDNRMGGQIAGHEMAKNLGNKGNVAVLRYNEGSASTENREEGFLEAIGKYPGINVVSSEQYGGVTRATAQQASENLLLRFKDTAGNLSIDGIFAPNTSTTYGMLQALKRQNLAGKVRFIGFDSEEPLLEGLRLGELEGLVVQDPFKMGYLGVVKIVDQLNGQKVEKRIDTGVTFIRAADLKDPRIQDLINPDLGKWLNQ